MIKKLWRTEVLTLLVLVYCLTCLLVGWVLGYEFPVRLGTDWPAIVPSTCFGFILVAASFFVMSDHTVAGRIATALALSWASIMPLGNLLIEFTLPARSIGDLMGFDLAPQDGMSHLTKVILMLSIWLLAGLAFGQRTMAKTVQRVCRIFVAVYAFIMVRQLYSILHTPMHIDFRLLSIPTLLLAIALFEAIRLKAVQFSRLAR